MRRTFDVFFVDTSDPGNPRGTGLFARVAEDVVLWRHHLACRPGLWLIHVLLSSTAAQVLDHELLTRHAVVDDFGTLQVVPA